MSTENDKFFSLYNLSATQFALQAKNNPTDPITDAVLTTRIKNLTFCLRDWFSHLPFQGRQEIAQCIQEGIENKQQDFFQQLQRVSLPAYQNQDPYLQKTFLSLLEQFSILAPINLNERRRHFITFFCKNLQHNPAVDRQDEHRKIQAIYNVHSSTDFGKGI